MPLLDITTCDQANTLFCMGIVTPTEIVDAIQQTVRQIDKKDVKLPKFSTLGTYRLASSCIIQSAALYDLQDLMA